MIDVRTVLDLLVAGYVRTARRVLTAKPKRGTRRKETAMEDKTDETSENPTPPPPPPDEQPGEPDAAEGEAKE